MTYYLKADTNWISADIDPKCLKDEQTGKFGLNFEKGYLKISPDIHICKFNGKIDLSRVIYKDIETAKIDYYILQEFHKIHTIKPLNFYSGDSTFPTQILTDFCPINLETYLKLDSKNEEEIANIIHEIILTMIFAHSESFIHNDLNPKTIILDEQYHVKIFGFKQESNYLMKSKDVDQFISILDIINKNIKGEKPGNCKVLNVIKQCKTFEDILAILENNQYKLFSDYRPFALNQIDTFQNITISVQRLTNPFYIEIMDDLHIHRVRKGEKADICWYDGFLRSEKIQQIPRNQILNKIPDINHYCYKTKFFQLLNNLVRKHHSYQKYYSKTFIFDPNYKEDFLAEFKDEMEVFNQTWIAKKDSSWGGHSVELFQDIDYFDTYRHSAAIQRYINPYLIDNHKFDMRIFVLVTDLDPFTFYVYNEALAKFSTQEYEEPNKDNIDNNFIHLTNICVNRQNPDHNKFRYMRLASEVIPEIEDEIEKRTGSRPQIFEEIKQCASLAMTALKPYIIQNAKSFVKLSHETTNIHQFFHLFGLDVIIDSEGHPRILEVNDNPSMKIEYPIKIHFKNVLMDELSLIISQKIDPKIQSENDFNWIECHSLPI